MKLSDIKVGRAYYYDRHNDWDSRVGGRRAVVVDDERYIIVRPTVGFRRGETPYRQDPKGTAVLVDMPSIYNAERIERVAVPAAHLRGPYDETKATVEANVAARRDAEQRAKTERADSRRRAEAAAAAAGSIGVDARRDFGNDSRMNVTTAQFAAMVDALAAAGWHYESVATS